MPKKTKPKAAARNPTVRGGGQQQAGPPAHTTSHPEKPTSEKTKTSEVEEEMHGNETVQPQHAHQPTEKEVDPRALSKDLPTHASPEPARPSSRSVTTAANHSLSPAVAAYIEQRQAASSQQPPDDHSNGDNNNDDEEVHRGGHGISGEGAQASSSAAMRHQSASPSSVRGAELQTQSAPPPQRSLFDSETEDTPSGKTFGGRAPLGRPLLGSSGKGYASGNPTANGDASGATAVDGHLQMRRNDRDDRGDRSASNSPFRGVTLFAERTATIEAITASLEERQRVAEECCVAVAKLRAMKERISSVRNRNERRAQKSEAIDLNLARRQELSAAQTLSHDSPSAHFAARPNELPDRTAGGGGVRHTSSSAALGGRFKRRGGPIPRDHAAPTGSAVAPGDAANAAVQDTASAMRHLLSKPPAAARSATAPNPAVAAGGPKTPDQRDRVKDRTTKREKGVKDVKSDDSDTMGASVTSSSAGSLFCAATPRLHQRGGFASTLRRHRDPSFATGTAVGADRSKMPRSKTLADLRTKVSKAKATLRDITATQVDLKLQIEELRHVHELFDPEPSAADPPTGRFGYERTVVNLRRKRDETSPAKSHPGIDVHDEEEGQLSSVPRIPTPVSASTSASPASPAETRSVPSPLPLPAIEGGGSGTSSREGSRGNVAGVKHVSANADYSLASGITAASPDAVRRDADLAAGAGGDSSAPLQSAAVVGAAAADALDNAIAIVTAREAALRHALKTAMSERTAADIANEQEVRDAEAALLERGAHERLANPLDATFETMADAEIKALRAQVATRRAEVVLANQELAVQRSLLKSENEKSARRNRSARGGDGASGTGGAVGGHTSGGESGVESSGVESAAAAPLGGGGKTSDGNRTAALPPSGGPARRGVRGSAAASARDSSADDRWSGAEGYSGAGSGTDGGFVSGPDHRAGGSDRYHSRTASGSVLASNTRVASSSATSARAAKQPFAHAHEYLSLPTAELQQRIEDLHRERLWYKRRRWAAVLQTGPHRTIEDTAIVPEQRMSFAMHFLKATMIQFGADLKTLRSIERLSAHEKEQLFKKGHNEMKVIVGQMLPSKHQLQFQRDANSVWPVTDELLEQRFPAHKVDQCFSKLQDMVVAWDSMDAKGQSKSLATAKNVVDNAAVLYKMALFVVGKWRDKRLGMAMRVSMLLAADDDFAAGTAGVDADDALYNRRGRSVSAGGSGAVGGVLPGHRAVHSRQGSHRSSSYA